MAAASGAHLWLGLSDEAREQLALLVSQLVHWILRGERVHGCVAKSASSRKSERGRVVRFTCVNGDNILLRQTYPFTAAHLL